MPRFLIAPGTQVNECVYLDAKESHHAIHVLRLAVGDSVDLLDGKGGGFKGEVHSIENGRLKVRVLKTVSGKTLTRAQVTLAVSVIKPERMEWLVEKASELGVHRLIPVLSDRSVVRLSADRWQAKTERWRRIAEETCKQCGRTDLPMIDQTRKWTDLLRGLDGYDLILIPTLEGLTAPLPDVLAAHLNAKKVLVLIGPEGDFTPEEIDSVVSRGAQAVTLGERVLRSETAAIFVLSVLEAHYSRYYID